MSFKYSDIKKDVFVNKYKWSNKIEDYKNFLNKIKKLKSYLVEFNRNSIMKNKIYLFKYIIKIEDYQDYQLIIIIVQNKYCFLENNSISKD